MGILLFILSILLFTADFLYAKNTTKNPSGICVECHELVTPGIVNDWKSSKHYKVGSVGCIDCHSGNERPDTFSHNGFRIHMIPTPKDCRKCHTQEVDEYENNIMSYAYKNLMFNDLFSAFKKSVNHYEGRPLTEEDSCLSCHGTKLEVKGQKERETLFGIMEFVQIEGWPNTGVGRLNPDGSKGSCAACHPRHSFSVGVARKPEACSRCHKGPDVPAYKIYTVSKHGILYSSKKGDWNFDSKEWVAGKDYTAPTCATCHMSEVKKMGEIVAKRTHMVSDRLSHRLFGIPYATAYPKSPETYKVRNRAGLPLLCELTGEPVTGYLISREEQIKRRNRMKSICSVCHATPFIERHFSRLDEAIYTTNEITKKSTDLLLSSWKKKKARTKDGIFNEFLERLWVENWLFYGNSVRLASAMGGADYGVFEGGRWGLTKNLEAIREWKRILFSLTVRKKTDK
ncbi:MAG: multiheme c-type cytochrome [Deltaproteobacteria bacterium]|nr:multiheme c-type cytochrome [Deltaproteobacteria bacterium]